MENREKEEVKNVSEQELTQEEKELLNDKDAMEALRQLNQNLIRTLHLSRFRSLKRAIKRGHITPLLELKAKRPFNNRANTSNRKGKHSRAFSELIRQIYEGRRTNKIRKEEAERNAAKLSL